MKILICDDERLVRTIVSTILLSAGHQVETACDGREALARIQAGPDDFDLLITDNRMPGLTGVELVQELRAMRLPLKILMICGFPHRCDKGARDRLDLDGFLNKPFKPADLLERVNDLLCVH